MKIEIKNHCIRCGICVGLYPELFSYNYEKDCIDVLKDPNTEALQDQAKASADDCAVAAIVLKDMK
jgi:ferredoxin